MGKAIVVVGVDLAGSPRRPTGICTLRALRAETSELLSDEDILRWIFEAQPVAVGIDAPLSLPPGRRTLEERDAPHLRDCERELLRRGIRVFPLTLGPMRSLTRRGIALRQTLQRRRIPCFEAYPGGAQDAWGIPRKSAGVAPLRRGLARRGIRDLRPTASHHELDAASAALLVRAHLQGRTEVLGGARSAPMILPRARRSPG